MKEGMEINLKDLFWVLVKRIWIIVLSAVVLGSAVLIYTMNFVAPQYKASVTMYVNNNSTQEGTAISSNDLAVALRLVNTYVNVIRSDKVLEKVITETNLALSTNDVKAMISASVVDETEMFKVVVTSPNPQMSADLANAIAEVAPSEIAEIIEGSSAKIIDYAKIPTGRSSPSYSKNAILGALAGAVLAVAVIVAINLLDVRVKTEDDLMEVCAVPVLGVIPDITSLAKRHNKKEKKVTNKKKMSRGEQEMSHRQQVIRNESFAVKEAYKTLRTNVRFFLRGKGCKRICITSGLASEGKSVTLLNLALSIAEAGQRVLLIDADLRRPVLAKLLGEKATPGLSNLLAGLVETEDVLRKEIYPNMDVIYSGDTPPNPSELLGSERLAELIEEMTPNYDYILVDTPPVNVVSDACIAANFLDGVLVLVRSGISRKEGVKRAVTSLQLTGAKPLGFVLNGVIQDGGRRYGYGYRYHYYNYYYTRNSDEA